MKSFPCLNTVGIWPVEVETHIYLYAPLTGIIAKTEASEIEDYEIRLAAGEIPDDIRPLIAKHSGQGIISPEHTSELTILINQRCNFSCKYCYSANGRSKSELPEELLPALSRWFVRKERLNASGADHLGVTFSGGGDPTLSIGKLRRIVEMMRTRADSQNIRIKFNMVCNGSRLRSEDISFIQDNIDNIVISFDVIPEVHDAQRSHYETVAGTIRMLTDNGVKCGLRSTITPLNVDRMEEMVKTLHSEFPKCDSLAAEVVFAPRMWRSDAELAIFHEKFANNFFKARRLADKYGISLGNTIEMSSDGLKSRTCDGKVVVTPEGKLTACSRVATPGDYNYDDFLFGEITSEGVIYDVDKYNGIMSMRADRFNECESCFARYHCGGGCMVARLSYSPAQMKLHCDLTRKILKLKLFYELD